MRGNGKCSSWGGNTTPSHSPPPLQVLLRKKYEALDPKGWADETAENDLLTKSPRVSERDLQEGYGETIWKGLQ